MDSLAWVDDIDVKPLANTSPSGVATSTASPAAKSPVTSVAPTASKEAPPFSKALLAPASTFMQPLDGTAKPIQSLRAESLDWRARNTVPTSSPVIAPITTPCLALEAITASTPECAAILAAESLEAIPPRD